MYKLPHLLTFRAVCGTGSFALAARELGYTASAVSQHMAALERDTGLVLFEREAHGIRPTAAADRLLELSRPLLAGLDDFDYQVRQLAGGLSGRIRLGSFPTASVRLVPGALSAFGERCPGAEVTLEESEPDELMTAVVAGELDVALVYEYALCPRRWPDGVLTRPLLREELLVLRPPDGLPSVELPRLAGRRWITSGQRTAGALSLTRLCAAAGFTPRIAFRSDNYDVVRELVVATGGVAVVPALGHRPDDRLAAAPTVPPSHRTVLAVCRKANTNPLTGPFLHALTQAVPPDAPHLTPLV
ncbi:LysR family transcriptional regulator [Streptomyces sp. B6B3]|uniref:LysR family transcriptional regulator n=1 Tax=Streptomyces sp. B6B3 TaxID=3153570 RepID=UPI00325D641F